MYEEIAAAYMPALLGWYDGGEHPLLVLEDLSESEWPPPWTQERIDAVRATLAEVAATPPPTGMATVTELIGTADDWSEVAAAPEPFLSLGLCTPQWLAAHWKTLLASALTAPLDGHDLLHLDVRSDNLCIRRGRAVLFDWAWAAIGNAEVDLAFWLPSLRVEGGPPPWDMLPGRGAYGARAAGFWAARAGLPPPAGAAPGLRDLQRRQLEVVLEWAVRELGLPPPRLPA